MMIEIRLGPRKRGGYQEPISSIKVLNRRDANQDFHFADSYFRCLRDFLEAT